MDQNGGVAGKYLLLGGEMIRLAVLLQVLLAPFISAQSMTDRAPHEVKEYTRAVAGGSLILTLFSLPSTPGGRTSISITTAGTEAEPTIDDELAGLKEVIADLPSHGIDPHSLKSIHLGIFETSSLNLIQLRAARSQLWRDCVATSGCNGNHIVLRLLKDSHIYDRINEALVGAGLCAKLTYLEDMIARPIPDPGTGKGKKIVLPVAGVMEFTVSSDSKCE